MSGVFREPTILLSTPRLFPTPTSNCIPYFVRDTPARLYWQSYCTWVCLMATKEKLVVIGNGMGGARFVEEPLARKGRDHFDIVMFGDEPYGNYNRILLSSVLAGSHEPKDIFLNPLEWYQENGITLHLGVGVESIDRARKMVCTADGIQQRYDRLVFATGSKPFVPPI